MVHRSNGKAIHHDNVLRVFQVLIVSQIEKLRASFERKLQASFLPLLKCIELQLEKIGKKIGGKGNAKATKSHITRAVKRSILEFLIIDIDETKESLSSSDDTQTTLKAMHQIFLEEGVKLEDDLAAADPDVVTGVDGQVCVRVSSVSWLIACAYFYPLLVTTQSHSSFLASVGLTTHYHNTTLSLSLALSMSLHLHVLLTLCFLRCGAIG